MSCAPARHEAIGRAPSAPSPSGCKGGSLSTDVLRMESTLCRPRTTSTARRRLVSGVALLLAAGCGSPSEPPAAVSVASTSAIGEVTTPRPPEGDPLCTVLGRIVDAEPEGFLLLRGTPSGANQWNGTTVPEGFRDCWIEDRPTGALGYACSGTFAEGSPDSLAAEYLRLAAAVESCLQQPTWYPLSWHREAQASLPDGGHRIIWRDTGRGPTPTVVLGLEPHPGRTLWFVRLAVEPSG